MGVLAERLWNGMTEETVATAVARRVRALREARGWNSAELARRSSVSAPTAFRAEQGEQEPSLTTLLKLADGFGVSPLALLRDGAEGDVGAAVEVLVDQLAGDPIRARQQIRAMLRGLVAESR